MENDTLSKMVYSDFFDELNLFVNAKLPKRESLVFKLLHSAEKKFGTKTSIAKFLKCSSTTIQIIEAKIYCKLNRFFKRQEHDILEIATLNNFRSKNFIIEPTKLELKKGEKEAMKEVNKRNATKKAKERAEEYYDEEKMYRRMQEVPRAVETVVDDSWRERHLWKILRKKSG